MQVINQLLERDQTVPVLIQPHEFLQELLLHLVLLPLPCDIEFSMHGLAHGLPKHHLIRILLSWLLIVKICCTALS